MKCILVTALMKNKNVAKVLFLLPLPDYRYAMDVLFSVKIFDIEFSPDLHVLRSPESKKTGFWKLVCAYVYVCVSVYVTLT